MNSFHVSVMVDDGHFSAKVVKTQFHLGLVEIYHLATKFRLLHIVLIYKTA